MYRKQDYDYLQNIYERDSNDVIIVYGDRRTCISDLVISFSKDKPSFYYYAPCVEHVMQEHLFIKELHSQIKIPKYIDNNFDDILSAYIQNNTSQKSVLIFDEFDNLIPGYSTFLNYLLHFVSDKVDAGSILIILCSTNIKYIKESVINSKDNIFFEISDVINVSKFNFSEVCELYPDISLHDIATLYSVIGGNQLFWNNIDLPKDNDVDLIKNIFKANNQYIEEGFRILPDTLRQTSVYNSILYAISLGYETLNELHLFLHIDRAKLSVYLQTLISHELIHKCISKDIGNKSFTKKGLYSITDPYVKFWYSCIFNNISIQRTYSFERFYKKIIEPEIDKSIKYYLPLIGKHVLENDKSTKQFLSIDKIENYFDKNDIIDWIITTGKGEVVICVCDKYQSVLNDKNFSFYIEYIKKSKIDYKYIIFVTFNETYKDSLKSISSFSNVIIVDKSEYWKK